MQQNKTNTIATLQKTSQPRLIKENWGIDLLHEIQLLRNDMNKNHSELSMKVDSTTTELKSVQSNLSGANWVYQQKLRNWKILLYIYYLRTLI